MLGFLNPLGPRQNGRHFLDDIFKCIFLNENVQISNKISLKFVLRVSINSVSALSRRQAIIWASDGLLTDAYMRHSASVSWNNVE